MAFFTLVRGIPWIHRSTSAPLIPARRCATSPSVTLNSLLVDAHEIGVPETKFPLFVFKRQMEMFKVKEMEMMMKDLHFNYKCELAELKVAISSLSQRVVFESFMEDSVPFLQELETVTPKEKAALSELHPKMNVLNRVLRRCWPNVGERLLPTFVINGQFVTDFPNLGRRGMMYGNLSDRVHTPMLRHVFVVKSESESVRRPRCRKSNIARSSFSKC